MTPDEKLDKILYILNGNGKIGICAKVNIMWRGGIFVIGTLVIQCVALIRILINSKIGG